MKTFSEVFGGEPEASGDAPGRVNLLGEHTDYSEGFVLPTAIAQRTRVTLRRGRDAGFIVYSANLEQNARFTLDAPPPETFARYVYGCVRELAGTGACVPNLDIHVASDVPIGVGLSSSAALEVATLRALHRLLGLDIDPVRIAQLAHRAENDHAGVRCGILDQMACSLLHGSGMLFLDTRSLDRKLVPLPEGSQVVVVDSGVPRELVSSQYNVRRAECEEASRLLGVRTLRDARDEAAIEALPEPWRGRARHVVTENRRASRAAEGVDARTFGALMAESHRSLKDNFEVSIPAMDELVADLMTAQSVIGAKLTGAGFGGACVALCGDDDGVPDIERVIKNYNRRGRRARVLAVVR